MVTRKNGSNFDRADCNAKSNKKSEGILQIPRIEISDFLFRKIYKSKSESIFEKDLKGFGH